MTTKLKEIMAQNVDTVAKNTRRSAQVLRRVAAAA